MSNNSREKEQTYRIKIENKRGKPLIFGTEPIGWYSNIEPDEAFDVVIIYDDDDLESFDLTEKEWGQEDSFTITHNSFSWVIAYLDNMLISAVTGPEKTEFDNPKNDIESKNKFRFVNKCENVKTLGVEPLGLVYDVPVKSELDLVISQKPNEILNMTVNDSVIMFHLPNIDIEIYIDGKIQFP